MLIVLHKLNERENAPKTKLNEKKADHLSFFTLRKSLGKASTHTHTHKLKFKLSDYYYHLLLVQLGLLTSS